MTEIYLIIDVKEIPHQSASSVRVKRDISWLESATVFTESHAGSRALPLMGPSVLWDHVSIMMTTLKLNHFLTCFSSNEVTLEVGP